MTMKRNLDIDKFLSCHHNAGHVESQLRIPATEVRFYLETRRSEYGRFSKGPVHPKLDSAMLVIKYLTPGTHYRILKCTYTIQNPGFYIDCSRDINLFYKLTAVRIAAKGVR